MENLDSAVDRDKWQVISGILAATLVFLLLFNVTISPRSVSSEGVEVEAPVSQPASDELQMVGGC